MHTLEIRASSARETQGTGNSIEHSACLLHNVIDGLSRFALVLLQGRPGDSTGISVDKL